MKKMIVSILITSALITFSLLIPTSTANAESLINIESKAAITSSSKTMATNDMIAQLQKKEVKPGAKLISQKTVFIRINNNNPNNIKKFTPEEYHKQIAKQKEDTNSYLNFNYINPNDLQSSSHNKYSWLELMLEVYNFQGQYTAYGYYEWKTAPQIIFNDKILMKGTNITFEYQGSSLQAFNPTRRLPYANVPTIYTSQSNGMIDLLNGISYKFPLKDDYFISKVNPYGVITVPLSKMTCNQASANLTLEYVHTQIPCSINSRLYLKPFPFITLTKMWLSHLFIFKSIFKFLNIKNPIFHATIETHIIFKPND